MDRRALQRGHTFVIHKLAERTSLEQCWRRLKACVLCMYLDLSVLKLAPDLALGAAAPEEGEGDGGEDDDEGNPGDDGGHANYKKKPYKK